MSLIDTCIGHEGLTFGQMAVMYAAARTRGDGEATVVDLATHQHGYLAAQAAGFALIHGIERMYAELSATPQYQWGSDPTDPYENPAWFDLENAMDAHAMSQGAIHAARIVDAQRRHDPVAAIVRRGADNLRLWCSLDDEGRRQVLHDPYDDYVDEQLADFHRLAA